MVSVHVLDEGGNGVSVHRRQHVRVGVQRHGDIGVTEAIGDDLDGDAGLEQQRRVGVPQVMEPDATEVAGGDELAEVVGQLLRVQRSAVGP